MGGTAPAGVIRGGRSGDEGARVHGNACRRPDKRPSRACPPFVRRVAAGVFVASRLLLPAAAGAWLLVAGGSPVSFLTGGSSGPAGAPTGAVAPLAFGFCSVCFCSVVRALRIRRFRFSEARTRSPAARRSRVGGEALGAWAVSAAPEPGRPWAGGVRRASARSQSSFYWELAAQCRRLPMRPRGTCRSGSVPGDRVSSPKRGPRRGPRRAAAPQRGL